MVGEKDRMTAAQLSNPIWVRNWRHFPLSLVRLFWKQVRMTMSPCPKNFLQSFAESVVQASLPRLRCSCARAGALAHRTATESTAKNHARLIAEPPEPPPRPEASTGPHGQLWPGPPDAQECARPLRARTTHRPSRNRSQRHIVCCALASWIVFHTRSGVAGISMFLTP
jgi:hypothetical protein